MGKRIIKYIKYFFRCILEVIYPQSDKCIICGELVKNQPICLKCSQRIKMCNGSINISGLGSKDGFSCYSASYYSDIIREMIIRLKYKSDFICGYVLANYMYKIIEQQNIKYDIITFIPMTKKRIKIRGYNQSKYLAKCIGKKNNTKVVKCLYKVKDTKDQIGLNGEERWKNIKDSFEILENVDIKHKRILLVDDVVTTGATTCICAEELKKNGAKSIKVLTAAKSKI